MKSSVLVVDDDVQAARVLTHLLTNCGYEVRTTNDADAALSALRGWRPDAIITDLGLPHASGLDLCRRVRDTSNVPIIMVSSTTDDATEIAALDAGADDYLARPYGTEKLLAHLRAALRRHPEMPELPVLTLGDFALDFHEHRVRLRGQPVRLTPKEFDLFTFMARHPNRVLHHKTLLGAVWGEEAENQPEYLRVFVGQLRKKLESDPPNPRYVVTEPWVGYRFNPTGLMQ
jgi:two-component system, OmpR family, KDP operon response regulator KdpE